MCECDYSQLLKFWIHYLFHSNLYYFHLFFICSLHFAKSCPFKWNPEPASCTLQVTVGFDWILALMHGTFKYQYIIPTPLSWWTYISALTDPTRSHSKKCRISIHFALIIIFSIFFSCLFVTRTDYFYFFLFYIHRYRVFHYIYNLLYNQQFQIKKKTNNFPHFSFSKMIHWNGKWVSKLEEIYY